MPTKRPDFGCVGAMGEPFLYLGEEERGDVQGPQEDEICWNRD